MNTPPEEFDVYLAHNSDDKPSIEVISNRLRQSHGLNPWLDKEQILPGRWFQDVIQQAIRGSQAAAIFFGPSGLGRWQVVELRSFIRQCIERDIPVIPVLLPGADEYPNELTFLSQLHGVKFESLDDEDALNSLANGIRGGHPIEVDAATTAEPLTAPGESTMDQTYSPARHRDELAKGVLVFCVAGILLILFLLVWVILMVKDNQQSIRALNGVASPVSDDFGAIEGKLDALRADLETVKTHSQSSQSLHNEVASIEHEIREMKAALASDTSNRELQKLVTERLAEISAALTNLKQESHDNWDEMKGLEKQVASLIAAQEKLRNDIEKAESYTPFVVRADVPGNVGHSSPKFEIPVRAIAEEALRDAIVTGVRLSDDDDDDLAVNARIVEGKLIVDYVKPPIGQIDGFAEVTLLIPEGSLKE